MRKALTVNSTAENISMAAKMRLNGRSNRRFMSMWVMIVTFEYGSVFFGCVQRGVCMRTKKMKKMNKVGKSYFKGKASTSSLYSIVFVSRFLWKWENNHSELWIIKNEAISSFVCIQREKKYWCSKKVCEREREGRKKNESCSHWKIKFSSQVFALWASFCCRSKLSFLG